VGAIYTLGNAAANRLSLLLLTLISAEVLDVDSFGVFSLFLMSVASIASISAFGGAATINSVVSKFYMRSKDLASSVLTMSMLMSVFVSLFLSALFSPAIYDIANASGAYEFVFIYFLLFILSLLMAVFSSLEGAVYALKMAKGLLAFSLLGLLLSVASSYFLGAIYGVYGAIASIFIHRLYIALSAGRLAIGKTGLHVSVGSVKRNKEFALMAFRRLSFPIAAASVLAAPAVTLALYILGKREGVASVAEFSIVYQCFVVAIFPAGAIGQYLIAKSKGVLSEAVNVRVQAAKYLFVYGVVAFLGFWVAAIIASHYFHGKYEISISSFLLMGGAASIYCINCSYSSFWSSLGYAWPIFYSQIFMAGSILLCSLTLGETSLEIGFLLGSVSQIGVNIVLLRLTVHEKVAL
jgi:O-antigen/teichoic acid export membrane protein